MSVIAADLPGNMNFNELKNLVLKSGGDETVLSGIIILENGDVDMSGVSLIYENDKLISIQVSEPEVNQ